MGHHGNLLEELVQKTARKQPFRKHIKPVQAGLTHSEMLAFGEAEFFTDIAYQRWFSPLKLVVITALLALLLVIAGVVWW